MERLKSGQEQLVQKTAQDIKVPMFYTPDLQKFASEGFRTLVMAKKELSEEHFATWNEKFNEAQAELEDREEKV